MTAPTATYTVKFRRRNGNGKVPPSGRIPRVTRLLALAHRIEGMIRSGELRDWAEAARIVGVTRARMTQVANLLLLAPEIQEIILTLRPIAERRDPVTGSTLRALVTHGDWVLQARAWQALQLFPLASR
ncbi:MAG: hypothetical protein HY509_06130 [Acidobacteria bacterium]|nr:hypothetical protein [Acidobacteriota bacterium]